MFNISNIIEALKFIVLHLFHFKIQKILFSIETLFIYLFVGGSISIHSILILLRYIFISLLFFSIPIIFYDPCFCIIVQLLFTLITSIVLWIQQCTIHELYLSYYTAPYEYCTRYWFKFYHFDYNWCSCYTVLYHASIVQRTGLSRIVVPIEVGLQILMVSFKRLNWSLATKYTSITLLDIVYLFKFEGRLQSLIAFWTVF